MSAALTLQGAVAHCDMPLESGPTMLLPHSQKFVGGYIAFYRPEFIDYFADHHVQVPLRKGDAVFFNPALYHGAGANTSTDIRRMANLLQISSPFGRAMESLDRTAMVRAVYPALLAMKAAGPLRARPAQRGQRHRRGLRRSPPISTSDQPIGSLAPPSQVDTVLAALADGLTPEAPRHRTRSSNRTENSMTTLGVIGLGRIGAFHTETLSGLAGLDGLVITDERGDVAEAVAAKHGAKYVATVEELLSSGVDGVVVAAATPAHAELTLAAVERGIPTFCEKPIASTAAESARVAEVILKSGRARAGRLPAPVRRGVRRGQARRRRRLARAPCTPCAAPRWTPLPRRWTTSRARAASSATAPCTTSTSSTGSPGSAPSRCTPPAPSRAIRCSPSTATSTPPR